ncbi:MAG TPA: tetratricopeptide repeat protein [Stellaceae bacterium]|nr:tetratricopeptide repeat protein [Stellaceae bacterium]
MPLSDDIKDLIEHDNACARRLLHGIVAEAPHSVEARFLLAQAYLRRMEVEKALPLYLGVIERDPKLPEARHAAAYCRLVSGDYPGALAAYREAFQKLGTVYALGMSALVLHRMGRVAEAVATYEKFLKVAPPASPSVPAVLQGMVAALRDGGKALAAEHYAHDLLERFRRDPVGLALPLIDRNNALDFHEWWRWEDKAHLARATRRFAARSPAHARFPESFVLPEDRAALTGFALAEPGVLLIAKPKNGTGGQGIVVTADLGRIAGRDDVVVQRYLSRPFLVEGRKAHLRIYCLITAPAPLRAYVYGEGIVRFAPEPYDPRPEALANNAMHVTNTALHRGNPALVVSQDARREDEGHVWSLSAYLKRLSAAGGDGQAVFQKIERLIAWFVRMVASEGLFEHQAKAAPPRAFTPKLFGLDVLIDRDGEPWLIEMQVKPAAAGSPLVARINGELFATVLRMSTGVLIPETLPAAERAKLLADPREVARRERALEEAERGLFRPLDLSA